MKNRILVLVIAAGTVLLTAGLAQALPAQTPDTTGGVNGPVRALVQVQSAGQNLIWIGGHFSQILDTSGTGVAAAGGLAPFDDTTGALDTSVHIPIVSGGSATVFDLSLGSNGNLYMAGSFTAVDGATRHNVAAIDPTTGNLLPFAPKGVAKASSILATPSAIYVGTGKLLSFQLSGAKTAGYAAPLAHIDATIRAHTTIAQFRDIAEAGSTLVAACQCDSMDDANGTGHPVKAVVEVDANTGDLLSWAPANLPATSAAFGISLIVQNSIVYLAAGGNDFTAAYDFSTGHQQWKTDTSGSSQAIAMYQGDLVIGGHFDWTASPSSGACGDNNHPNTSCYHTPKLAAMNASTGAVILLSGNPWNPGICCKYNGVWVVLPDANGTQLHVGGEFTKAGGTWSGSGTSWTLKTSKPHSNYARFSDAPVTG